MSSKKAPKSKLCHKKRGRTGGKLRSGAERSSSPRIAAKKRASTKKKRSDGKQKRFANLNRGGSLSVKRGTKASASTADQSTSGQSKNLAYKRHLSQAKEALVNPVIQPCKKGKQHSAPLIMLMIRIVSLLVTLKNSLTTVCSMTTHLVGVSKNLIREHVLVMLWFDKKKFDNVTNIVVKTVRNTAMGTTF